jgi:hypothetical protein
VLLLNIRQQALKATIHLFHRATQALLLLDILQLTALEARNIHQQALFTVLHRLSTLKILIKIQALHIQAQQQAVLRKSINNSKINMASAGKLFVR